MAQQTMYAAKVNSPNTTLRTSISAIDTTVPVGDSSVLPPAPNLATIGSDSSAETILYTGKDGSNNLTGVTRGFQGSASAWGAGVSVGRFFTAYDHDTFVANINDLAGKLNGVWVRANAGTPEWSLDGSTGWTPFVTAAQVQQTAIAITMALG